MCSALRTHQPSCFCSNQPMMEHRQCCKVSIIARGGPMHSTCWPVAVQPPLASSSLPSCRHSDRGPYHPAAEVGQRRYRADRLFQHCVGVFRHGGVLHLQCPESQPRWSWPGPRARSTQMAGGGDMLPYGTSACVGASHGHAHSGDFGGGWGGDGGGACGGGDGGGCGGGDGGGGGC